MKQITVELEVREARALVSAAGFIMGALGHDLDGVAPPGGSKVFPLESAQMKLESAMVIEGCEQ